MQLHNYLTTWCKTFVWNYRLRTCMYVSILQTCLQFFCKGVITYVVLYVITYVIIDFFCSYTDHNRNYAIITNIFTIMLHYPFLHSTVYSKPRISIIQTLGYQNAILNVEFPLISGKWNACVIFRLVRLIIS